VDGFFRNFGSIVDELNNALMFLPAALICLTIHELAHGYTAYKLGDTTAKDMGRLTLNPIKHIDPIGLLMILVLRFGWAKPVPVDMRNFKNPKLGMAVTALAGPLSNLLLAIVFFLLFGLFSTVLTGSAVGEIIARIVFNTIFLSIVLAVFNMLPIPPLDGSKVLFSVLPEKAYYKLMKYERFGIIALLVIFALQMVFGISILGQIIWYPANVIFSGLSVFFDFTYNLVN